MIEREAVVNEGGEMEMYVGEGEGRMKLMSVKTRVMYRCLRRKEVRRPAGEKAWKKVMGDMDVEGIWRNLRVKWNSTECEHLDFLLRHNRVFNNLTISRFDVNVKKECDVCGVGVETCMHEFVECCELEGFFGGMKALINRCWEGGLVERMEWRELWLFGVIGKVKGCNVNLLNYVLSHARFAVKLRRNLAHFEKKKIAVWSIFKSIMKRDVHMVFNYLGDEEFLGGFVEGSTFITIVDDGVKLDFG